MENQGKQLSTHADQLLQALSRERSTSSSVRTRFHVPGAQEVFERFYHHVVTNRYRRFFYDEIPEIKEITQRVGEWISAPSPTYGLIFAGSPGCGKTSVMNALQLLISCSKLDDPKNYDVTGHPAKACLKIRTARELYRLCGEREEDFNKIMNAGLLGIDDLGDEPAEKMIYGTIYDPLKEILTYRYENRLFTIVTTNLVRDQIEEKYGIRILDRMNDMMERIAFPTITFRTEDGVPRELIHKSL